MNFFPMNAGGGKLEETVLWTNSSPTSSFGSTNISLSNNIADYDYLRIYYRTSTSIDTSSYVDVPVAEFINKSSVSTNKPMWTLETLVNNAYTVAQRTITYSSSSNAIVVSGCSLINYGNNTVTNSQNTYTIPTKVSGLKKTSSGGGYENEYNPQAIYNSSLNVNSANTNISVTSGKTYSISYNDSNVYSSSSVTGGNILFETHDGGIDWGTRAYCYQLIVKATASTMSITNSKNRVWSLIVVQLD